MGTTGACEVAKKGTEACGNAKRLVFSNTEVINLKMTHLNQAVGARECPGTPSNRAFGSHPHSFSSSRLGPGNVVLNRTSSRKNGGLVYLIAVRGRGFPDLCVTSTPTSLSNLHAAIAPCASVDQLLITHKFYLVGLPHFILESALLFQLFFMLLFFSLFHCASPT